MRREWNQAKISSHILSNPDVALVNSSTNLCDKERYAMQYYNRHQCDQTHQSLPDKGLTKWSFGSSCETCRHWEPHVGWCFQRHWEGRSEDLHRWMMRLPFWPEFCWCNSFNLTMICNESITSLSRWVRAKKDVTPVRQQCSCVFLALTYRSEPMMVQFTDVNMSHLDSRSSFPTSETTYRIYYWKQ